VERGAESEGDDVWQDGNATKSPDVLRDDSHVITIKGSNAILERMSESLPCVPIQDLPSAGEPAEWRDTASDMCVESIGSTGAVAMASCSGNDNQLWYRSGFLSLQLRNLANTYSCLGLQINTSSSRLHMFDCAMKPKPIMGWTWIDNQITPSNESNVHGSCLQIDTSGFVVLANCNTNDVAGNSSGSRASWTFTRCSPRIQRMLEAEKAELGAVSQEYECMLVDIHNSTPTRDNPVYLVNTLHERLCAAESPTSGSIRMAKCDGQIAVQKWYMDSSSGPSSRHVYLKNVNSDLCLTRDEEIPGDLKMARCGEQAYQTWIYTGEHIGTTAPAEAVGTMASNSSNSSAVGECVRRYKDGNLFLGTCLEDQQGSTALWLLSTCDFPTIAQSEGQMFLSSDELLLLGGIAGIGVLCLFMTALTVYSSADVSAQCDMGRASESRHPSRTSESPSRTSESAQRAVSSSACEAFQPAPTQ
jgi:hypothetical protein